MSSEEPAKPEVAPPTDLVGATLAAANEVHRVLGPGFPAAIYENALCAELERVGVPFDREKLVGEHRPGLIVGGKFVLALKTAKAIDPIDFGIVRWALKALDLESAFILNFATAPLTIRRIERDTF